MSITTATDALLAELATRLTGALHLPGSADHARLATPWNVSVQTRPRAVVQAADAADVQAAVRWAGEHGVRVAVQSTGHGAAADLDGVLLVHTGDLQELRVAPDGLARIGAGVRWSQVLEAAAPHGLAPVAGSAPGVGVVGYLTGGGIGPIARTYGVSSDFVRAFEVVTGDGELRRATPETDPGLFWGLRGGKGALGVVTAVEVELVPLPTLFGGALFFAEADTAAVLHAWARWCVELPEQATTSVAINRLPAAPGVPEPIAGVQTVAVRFAWTGDPAEGERLLTPLREVAPVVFGGVGVLPAAAMGRIHSDPVDPMPTHERATMLQALPAAAVDALLAAAGPGSGCPQVIVELRQLGGAVRRRPEAPDAFCGRDVAFTLLTIGIAAGPVTALTDANAADVARAMEPWATARQLPNFAPSSDPEQALRVYDRDTLRRLGALVASTDPRGVLDASRPVREACLLALA